MRHRLIVLLVLALAWSAAPAAAQVSIDIGLPSVNIGINIPVFPELVVVPDAPVYYAPRLDMNYFFYDGMYWVYHGDSWYASYWYNGPWRFVAPEIVPVYVLRVPVRYYRHPPVYFREWRADAPPRWGEHWGHDWEQRHAGWDNWSRGSAPAPAPLPVYQRQYSGNRYPRAEQQQALHTQNYRYQPQDSVTRQHYEKQGLRAQRQDEPQQKNGRQQANQRATPAQPQEREAIQQKPAPAPAPPAQHPPQQSEPAVQGRRQQPPTAQHEQPAPAPAPRPQVQEKAAPHAQPAPAQEEPKQERRQERKQDAEQEKGQGHNK